MIPLLLSLLLPLSVASAQTESVRNFSDPIDALSARLPSQETVAQVSGLINGQWSPWQDLAADDEQEPGSLESTLVLFPAKATAVRVRGIAADALHPIRISTAPFSWSVAARGRTDKPRILSRSEWGADDSFLFRAPAPSSSGSPDKPADASDTGGGAVSDRERACAEAQVNYPREFKTIRKTAKDDAGRTYRWPLSYSPDVKLLVVHHTAVAVTGDRRTGPERVRALYAYHANNRGWGDVGYHYLIDEDGQIYEGKAGGKGVVGGHAYCHNIGSIGVALLGNFDTEQPPQAQLASLQWLLNDLATTYDIDVGRQTVFHGKKMSPIVGHSDLMATACPGYFVAGSLAQIRTHVASGTTDAVVTLPQPRTTVLAKQPAKTAAERAAERRDARLQTGQQSVSRGMQRILTSPAARALERKLRRSDTAAAATTPMLATTATRLAASVSTPPPTHNAQTNNDPTKNVPASQTIRIRLTRRETGAASCNAYDLPALRALYRGTVTCRVIDGTAALINTVDLEDYLRGLAEEPDTEPYEKQRAFAIAARTYAAHYLQPDRRKFPGMPYDGDDSPARFQLYLGRSFEERNPAWLRAVRSTAHTVLTVDGQIIRAPYYSANDGRTRSPEEIGWNNFPFAEVFQSKPDPWCSGETLRGHGVGMSGCGAKGQALEGKSAEEILEYYYPGTELHK